MDIPVLKKGQKVFLNFGSIRSRAEIFINQRLVDYQIVDNVPFETDITPYIKSGEQVQLAVRITDAVVTMIGVTTELFRGEIKCCLPVMALEE